MEPTVNRPAEESILGGPSPNPTEALLLKNLFDPADETQPEWWLYIHQDVGEECAKFGEVKHIFVDKDSLGNVYLLFSTKDAAVKARDALHSRWYAGRVIAVDYMFSGVYRGHFSSESTDDQYLSD